MPTRKDFLDRLIAFLKPQVVPGVDILVKMCDPHYTLGENRDEMVRASSAKYIAQWDDDDLPSEDAIATILPLLDGVDYIGHNLQLYVDGVSDPRVTKHSLQFSGWYETEEYYARDISHINPMRRDLALLEAFEGGHGEDHRWADRMRARGVVKTEHFVPKVLYHYFYRSNKNKAQPCPKCASLSTVRVEQGSACNACGHNFNALPEQKSCLWV